MKNFKGFLLITAIFIMALIFASCGPNKLTTSCLPPNGGTVSPSSGTFEGDVVLVASPSKYFKFDGWAGSASGNANPLTVNMSSDKQIIAQFSNVKYAVQIKPNLPSVGNINPGSGEYEAGSKVIFTATAASGYRFVKWGDDVSVTTNPLSILIEKDMVITANFVKQFTLTVSGDQSAGTVTVSPTPTTGSTYDEGTIVTPTATPNFPYAFKNWTGTESDTANPSKVTVNANKAVSVNFIKLVKKAPIQKSGNTRDGGNIPIDLNQSEWIEGTINCDTALPPDDVKIQSPDGQVIKDFGKNANISFQVCAPKTGKYYIIIKGSSVSQWGTNYNIMYSVYGMP